MAPDNAPIWANMVHLSYNMWADRDCPERNVEHISARPWLRFDASLWDDILKRMVEIGTNMVVIDLGDAVKYDSHPEIAVKKAWTPKRLRRELDKLRRMGLEPITKLNFSACHDAWLGPYSRCLSTDAYYAVCRDLIAEVIDLFDKPRFFHLGMDEATAQHQRHFRYVVIRQFDLWWHDFLFLVDRVERGGVRPWIWSDYVWNHPDEFFRQMPRSVLQSNWYYGKSFSTKINYVKAYLDLEAHGYDQVPTGSNWTDFSNFPDTVRFAARHIDPARLKGFMQTPWKPTLEDCRERHLQALDAVAKGIRWWQARQ